MERNHAVSPLLGELLLPLQSNFYLVYRQELNQLQCFQLREGGHSSSVITIGPRMLKFAEYVHTSFYSKYARFEEFSSICFKVRGKSSNLPIALLFRPGIVYLFELLFNQLIQWFIFHYSKFGSLTLVHNVVRSRNVSKPVFNKSNFCALDSQISVLIHSRWN